MKLHDFHVRLNWNENIFFFNFGSQHLNSKKTHGNSKMVVEKNEKKDLHLKVFW